MAIAEMRKFNLAAMSYDRDRILNALQRTSAVEIKTHSETENTVVPYEDGGSLREYLAKCENALSCLSGEVEANYADKKQKAEVLRDGFFVSYSDFMSAGDLRESIEETVEKLFSLENERKNLASEYSKCEKSRETALIYSLLTKPFSYYSDSAHTKKRLGTVPVNMYGELEKAVKDGLFALSKLNSDGDNVLVLIISHESENIDAVLQDYSFTACPYKEGTGVELYAGIVGRQKEINIRLSEISKEILSFEKSMKPLKIYCDYLGFELEKKELSEKFRATEKTFLLEAYVPKDYESLVAEAVDNVTNAAWYEFTEPEEDEIPPTYYKNNAVVKNFETITNMYSPASSKEFDPNTIMAIFYSIFLGFIMGDVGYGLIMFLGGGFIYMKKRGEDSGLKRLAGVFAIGGILAIVWGLLFNSFFGLQILFPKSVIPDAQNDMWSFMGIKIPSVLIISLEIGVVQLFTGYICKAVQCMRRGQFWDGILDGLVWAVFSLGVGLAIAGLVDELNFNKLAYIGGVIAGVCLVIAILTAGRKEKILGKFTKGFGAAYSVINYASDILSYARLYGLMLSGAVIAQIISSYAITGMNGGTGFIFSGNPALVILGVVLMLVGHVFNLAIGLLGAYIHDARLQYVEFYGRFYEGEGELFAPLGSNRKYIKLENSIVNK